MGGEAWVSPTRLALALSGGSTSEIQQEVSEGYVIVETNYRVIRVLVIICTRLAVHMHGTCCKVLARASPPTLHMVHCLLALAGAYTC